MSNEREALTLEPKDPDQPKTYSIDWASELVTDAKRSTAYVLGALVKPRQFAGFYLECTIAGETGERNIGPPRAAGITVIDGSATFESKHPDDIAKTAISSAAWDLQTGLTQDSKSESGTETHITVSGGNDGTDYRATCTMTPASGDPVDQTIIIPVRSR